MRLAIIPARGGSKRIPNKNIRPFCGRPIINWSIATALSSGLFDEVIVSTDSEEIRDVARAVGAKVPFLRSPRSSDDHATITDVLREVLTARGQHGERLDIACCLYATAPFVTSADLAAGLRILEDGDFDVVLPVCRYEYPIWRSLSRRADGQVRLNFPQHEFTRSQDLEPAYHDAGQWIWLRPAPFLAGTPLLGTRTGSIVIPAGRVQDIDTEDDWRRAEEKFREATR